MFAIDLDMFIVMWAEGVNTFLPGEAEASKERTPPLGKERGGGPGFSIRVKDDSEGLPRSAVDSIDYVQILGKEHFE